MRFEQDETRGKRLKLRQGRTDWKPWVFVSTTDTFNKADRERKKKETTSTPS